ncbi:MAG: tRNA (N6-isopentenyl adenosine(37)-C2)-methylthiotransferase MiaB [Rickettsiales bacterium]|nr:tRNA (N6-isopentenyl adenosine(37)-C2)-methylthiotransferase MiaB [Rickettsiales bacterium]
MDQSFFVKTYGCQMNQYDSEKIDELLVNNGFKKAKNFEMSDVAILNTCHIREKASEKFYSDLGRLSIFKKNKEKIGEKMQIVVMGCVAQAEGHEVIKRNSLVDYVVGPQNIQSIPKLLKTKSKEVVHTNFLCEEKFSLLPKSHLQGVSRQITIQEGCDKFCSFCVVPYTRGNEYSRSVEEIYAEAKNLIKNGALEINLLGQNVSSYNSHIFNVSEKKLVDLSKLCNILSSITELKRIRYITSHPSDINDELILEHKNNKKLMPFLHLPVQSGSNKILKKMNRKYSKESYINLITKIKREVKNMAFSSDFIVGYPGETDNDFQETLDLIDKVVFASSYSFKYSSRPGTPASLIKDKIDDSILNKRLNKIQKVLNEQQRSFNETFLDREIDVLFTNSGKKINQYVGRTPFLQPVHVFSSSNLVGKILKIKIERLTSFSFHGRILSS